MSVLIATVFWGCVVALLLGRGCGRDPSARTEFQTAAPVPQAA